MLAVLASAGTPRSAAAGALRVELVTVGPGSDDLELYGHSALCVTSGVMPESAADGRCYDFGVADVGEDDEDRLVWDTLRGKPHFVPVAIDRSLLVKAFEDMERSLWVQELPLDERQAAALQASLEASVQGHQPYAYHPYYDNCTTRLRDAIDQATGGELRRGSDAPADGPSFRARSEQGFSGRLFELTGLALFLGARADRQPSAWEAMFLPAGLRDAVAARLGAAPRQIHERREAFVPTSPKAGRVALVALGVLLAAALGYVARRRERRLRTAIGFVGVFLGFLGLAVDVVWLVSALPELGRNWVALVLVPTDALLAFGSPGLLRRYLAVRLGIVALLAVASVTGIVAQPLLAVCALAALPLAASYLMLRRAPAVAGARSARARPTAPGTRPRSVSPGDAR
jgi:hypothetical protein